MLEIELERSVEESELAKEKQLEAEFGQLLEVGTGPCTPFLR
jgi:hypothetical protein